MPDRSRVFAAAMDTLSGLPLDLQGSRIPVTPQQWERSLLDLGVQEALDTLLRRREQLNELADSKGAAIGRVLRPAALDLVVSTCVVANLLDVLGQLAPDYGSAGTAVLSLRRRIIEDAIAAVTALMAGGLPTSVEPWELSAISADSTDVMERAFGVPSQQLADSTGGFNPARLLAAYRLRLPVLQEASDRLWASLGERPPSVLSPGLACARDLVTGASPGVTLFTARWVRQSILESYDQDPESAATLVADSWRERDKEVHASDRLRQRMNNVETAETDRQLAFSLVEAYRHMAEGLTRRWVWSLLRIGGETGDAPTLGQLPQRVGPLGVVGEWVGAAILTAARNAEAHDDLDFDEARGTLIAGTIELTISDLIDRLSALDALQRGWQAGRFSALVDRPDLGDQVDRLRDRDAESAVEFAAGRFGHAGQHVRALRRNRHRVEIELEDLQWQSCNPCFLALVQSATRFPEGTEFVVRLKDREEPVIVLPSIVLHANLPVLVAAAQMFPTGLPMSTFDPCLTWARLTVEPLAEASRAAAYMVLNDVLHGLHDTCDGIISASDLFNRVTIAGSVAMVTLTLLPASEDVAPLQRALEVIQWVAMVIARPGTRVTWDVLFDRVDAARPGSAPAVLPTLDPSPMTASLRPHDVS